MTHVPSTFYNAEKRSEFDERHVMKFAKRNGATYTAMLRARLVVTAGLWCLGVGQLCLALSWRAAKGAACAEPLPLWMFTDGTLTILCASCLMIGIHRKTQVMGSTDLQAYLLRKDRGGDEDPALETQLSAVESGTLFDHVANLSACILVVMFCGGAYWYHSATAFGSCGGVVRWWTALVLILKLLVPCLSCCLAITCCLSAFFKHDPKESYWDDQPVDFW
uniref:Transmembrane protein n=1 Tax=Zooxanthella nutricula TaxID=1333877 RepID=A0A6V0EME3_9DINO|mmetsp:Transcript_16409/g.48931  ORF Transcript_16409/g.48931 Transcript_16409/m.48931 type:complete len:221 (+) Transcript_16409:64-726(+)